MASPGVVEIDPSNLVGISQISTRLEVAISTVTNWTKGVRDNAPFPEPITTVGRRKIYNWLEIEEWYKNYKPNRGGAPTGDRNGKRTVQTKKGWRNAN